MARTFLIVTQDDIDERIAESLRSRELELASYDYEQRHHEEAIEALGDLVWPEALKIYKGLPRDPMIIRAMEDGISAADIQTLVDLTALDNHKVQLQAVKTELAKSERHLQTTLTALPAGSRRNAAIAKVLAKQNAR